MSKHTPPKNPNRPKRSPRGDHKNGYCLPPDSGKIRPGEVRNPWGPKGKPKPEKLDPFEFAASQPTKITLNGVVHEVSAEAASYLVNMQKAIAGSERAHKNVQDERRSRRRAEPVKSPEEVRKEFEEEAERKEFSANLIGLFELMTQLKRLGLLSTCGNGQLGLPAWLDEAVADYREKHRGDGELGSDVAPAPSGPWEAG